MRVRDLDPSASPLILDVTVAPLDGEPTVIRISDDNPVALMAAVCTLVANGNEFLEGGDDWATLRRGGEG